MAEIVIGDVVARIRADATQFQQGIQAATQALTQFQQAMQQQASSVQPSVTRTAQAVQQLSQQLTLLNQQAISQTGFLGQMAGALDHVRDALQQTGTAAQSSGQQVSRFGDVWKTALGVAAGIGIATSLQGLIRQVIEFGNSTVQVGMQLQTLRASLTAISGSADSARQAFAFIVQTSNTTGQSIQALAAGYRGLSAATRGTALEGQDTERLFVALSTAARTYGLTTEQAGRVLVGFQQVISKGKVEQEELRQQIGEALPNALQIAARGFGVTTERLNEMIARGMDATTFVRTFTRQLQSELPTGTQSVETLAQAFNRLGNEIFLLKDKIAQSGLMQFLGGIAGGTANVLEATRKAEEQQGIFGETRARERFGGREVRSQEFTEMQALVQQEDQLRMNIEGVMRLRETGNLIQRTVAENQLRPLLRDFDALQTRISALQRVAPERFQVQQGIQARADLQGGGEDALRREQERERDIAAGDTRIRALLARQQEQLQQIDRTPFLQELDKAEERLKVITETTKQLRDLMQSMPAAVQEGMVAPAAPARRFQSMVERMALERGIDPRLAVALTEQESRFQPEAVSPKGALGLMQLMPGTAQQLQPGVTREQILEPETNVRLGLDYLAQLLRQFSGDVQRALTAYNAGPGRGGIPMATGENATFARDVLARIPSGNQGALAQQFGLQQAAEAAKEEAQGPTEGAARRRIAELREAERLQEQITQENIRDDEHRRDIIDQITKKLEQQASAARDALPGLEALVERADAFAGRAGQSLPEQARARVEQQGAAIAVALAKGIEQFTQSPALQQLAPHLGEQLDAVLKNLGPAIVAQGDMAAARVLSQTQQHVLGLQAELDQILTFSGRAGRSAPEQAQAQVFQQGAAAEAQLRRAIEEVSQSLDMQRLAPNLRAQLEAALAGLPEGVAAQGQLAFERADVQMHERIAGMGDQVDQLRMKLSAAGLSPLEQDLERIRREFAAMLDTLDKLEAKLGEEYVRATPARQEEIKALVDQIRVARPQVQPAMDEQVMERRLRPQREYLEQLQRQLEQSQVAMLGPPTLAGNPQLEVQLAEMRRTKAGEERLQTPEGRQQAEMLEDQIRSQERLNYAAGLFVEVGNSVGSAWGQALTSIMNGTASVSEAFRAMAQSIIQSLAQIASQEAFKALIGFGLRMFFGAALGGMTPGAAPGGGMGPDVGFGFSPGGASGDTSWIGGAMGGGGFGGGGFEAATMAFQHGGVVRRPTLAMLGENAATTPEYVLNKMQMEHLMTDALSRGPTAGGQAVGQAQVAVINVATEAQAEGERAKRESMGYRVVVNHVLKELAQGESSAINRRLRTLQR